MKGSLFEFYKPAFITWTYCIKHNFALAHL